MHRILLVDDDITLVEMVSEVLELEGFAVEAAHDGATALRRERETIDLIVLDVMLPKIDGVALLPMLRQ